MGGADGSVVVGDPVGDVVVVVSGLVETSFIDVVVVDSSVKSCGPQVVRTKTNPMMSVTLRRMINPPRLLRVQCADSRSRRRNDRVTVL
jgi:hypothetical protein